MSYELVIVLLLILAAELVNGWTDAPNAIATVVGTGSLTSRQAIAMACALNVIGVLSGTAVAQTIGEGIVDPHAITLTTVGSAMIAVVVWSSAAARWGLPTSESHALVAALAGAGLATAGPTVLVWEGWKKVLIGLVFSSLLGFVLSFVLVTAISWICRGVGRKRLRESFRWMQIVSSAFVAFSHGSNDGQKFMGAFTLALILGGVLGSVEAFVIPTWTIFLCATVMALGTSIGGYRIIRTLGVKLTKLETHQGFAAELAAGGTITLASALGIPLSTTHTIGTAVMGAGLLHGVRAVDWSVARQLAIAWLLTFPACGAIGWGAAKVAHRLHPTLQTCLIVAALVLLVWTLVQSRGAPSQSDRTPNTT